MQKANKMSFDALFMTDLRQTENMVYYYIYEHSFEKRSFMHKPDYLSVRQYFHLTKGNMKKDTKERSKSIQSDTVVSS